MDRLIDLLQLLIWLQTPSQNKATRNLILTDALRHVTARGCEMEVHTDIVPNITVVFKVFLTTCVSVALCERSFLKLKLVRINYLFSQMCMFACRALLCSQLNESLAQLAQKLDLHDVA